VGKAKNLRDRVSSYFLTNLLPKTKILVSEITKIDHIIVESEIDALLLEANLIKKYLPKYNSLGKDDKTYPYIEIDKEVKIVHQRNNKKAKYFGPYPTGSEIRILLKFLKIQLDIYPFLEPKIYHKNLLRLVKFLSGKRQEVQKQLKKEMEEFSKKQEYEKAAEIKKKLERLEWLTAPRTNPWEYQKNPNLVSDRRNLEINELEKILQIPKISKIEGYDISNISGKSASGGQVVFINGIPEKKYYRRYKIISKDSPDDYAMLSEMLSRRLKSDIPLPELFVIDGGRGQVDAIASLQHDVKTIGLAKRNEEIYTQNGEIIRLSKSSPALHLLQRVRDESHRFSRKYHFFLRKRNMLI
jgi:excinuclease ABC subunit C